MKKHCCTLLLFYILVSCMEEKMTGPDITTNKTLDVTLVFKLPAERKSPDTYALSEIDENHLSTVDVLVFKVDSLDASKEYYAYKVEGRDITDTEITNQKKTTVTLLNGGTGQYRLVILANARDEVNTLGEIGASELKEDILKRLITDITGEWITDTNNSGYRSIPMWGESVQVKINQTSQIIDGLNLLRMLARIDVQVAEDLIDSFKLKSVRLFNYNTRGYVAPYTDSKHWDGQKVLTPSIPIPAGRQRGPFIYDQLTENNRSIIGGIYVIESAFVDESQFMDATCLVIGGEYKNEGKETYYRVDITYTDSNSNISYANILRNHLYNINIVKVNGSGYNDPEDALGNESVNIISDILIWDQGGMTEVTLDGYYKLNVSQSEFVLPMNQRTHLDQDNLLTIFTDFPEGWSIEKIVDKDDNFISASWLTANRYVGFPNVETTISLLTDENNTEMDRTAYVYIKADRMVYVVKVTQTTVPEINLNLMNGNGEKITDLLFNSHVGAVVPSQDLFVNWIPRSINCSVSTISVVGISDFDFGTGDAIEPELIIDANGQKKYTIQPPAMTQAEINVNPFLEKALRVDYTVNNGVSYESKVLFLMQKNYAAVPTTHISYIMDGSEQYFTINANAPWEIEVTNDPQNIISQLITTRGGLYEDKRDEKVYFKLIDDLTNPSILNAEVTFTIKSTNADRPFPDKTVTIQCTSFIPKKRLLTIGGSPNGYGYNFSGTAASNKLITTPANFGTLPQSIVKSEGFTIIDGGINPTQTQMQDWLINAPVDIVIIGYDNANISTTIASYYAQYLTNGGVLLAFQDRTDALVSGNLLRAVLNSDITLSYATGAGSVFQFKNLDLEVLNGAFGDIRGRQWGEDASATVKITGVNAGLVDVLSDDKDISTTSTNATPGAMTAFIHRSLNFIWAGDGGFNSNNTGTDLTICPFKLNGSNYPIAKTVYGRGTVKYPVDNSIFTANAIAWALKKSSMKKK